MQLGKDATHQGAVARLRALDECLTSHTFGGHEKVARKHIAVWQRLCEQRAYLAHARLKAHAAGITITPIDFARGDTELPKSLTRIEMLDLLEELEQGYRLLHSHLGQIKAHAEQAKPVSQAKPRIMSGMTKAAR